MAGSEKKSRSLPNESPTDNPMKFFDHGMYLTFSLNKIDRRTSLGRAQQLLWDYLRAYVGECSVVTEMLLSRIIYKAIKCYHYENTDIKKKDLDLSAGKLYLAYTNSLRCDLAELNRMAAAPKEKDLMTYLKENYGKTSK